MNDLFTMDGRVAVVTGAGSGLGRAYAHALAQAGACVICADVDAAAGKLTRDAIEAAGGRAEASTVDVGDEASVQHWAALIASAHPRLHVLVNNAGITSLPARTHETTVRDWDRVMNVNVRGTFLCSRALLPLMMNEGATHAEASIINVASIIGLVGVYPGFAVSGVPYAGSKGAIVGLSRQMAAEYARDGVRVNVIAPGWHGGTNLGWERRALAASKPEETARFEEHIVRSVPMGRRGAPSEMDGLIVYLASDASRYVTGQVFAHDGGLTAS